MFPVEVREIHSKSKQLPNCNNFHLKKKAKHAIRNQEEENKVQNIYLTYRRR